MYHKRGWECLGARGEDDSIHVAKKKAAEDLANKMQEKQKKKEADEKLGQDDDYTNLSVLCINMVNTYVWIYLKIVDIGIFCNTYLSLYIYIDICIWIHI